MSIPEPMSHRPGEGLEVGGGTLGLPGAFSC